MMEASIVLAAGDDDAGVTIVLAGDDDDELAGDDDDELAGDDELDELDSLMPLFTWRSMQPAQMMMQRKKTDAGKLTSS